MTVDGSTTLNDLIARHGLEAAGDPIRSLLKEAIRLVTIPIRGAHQQAVISRFGGAPDLPAGTDWPDWRGVPMAFVGQIHLADLVGFAPARVLPAEGLLSFFYDSQQSAYGASPDDHGGWWVSWFAESAKLQPAAFPTDLPGAARFAPCALRFEAQWTLPDSAFQADARLQWGSARVRQYEALLREFRSTGERRSPHHRMFGWPDQLQDDMQLQSALMSRGITEMSDPRARLAKHDKRHWQLLLQVDSDDAAGMRWRSHGMINYWMTGRALKSRRFDQAWLVLQSD